MPLNGPGPWTQPLNRVVSFKAADLSLREAIDRLAATHKLRVSYSSDALALDRTVCIALDSVQLGDVFAELLRGTGVEPIVAGANHVVLAPVTESLAERPAPSPPVVLDRIVVTGNPGGGGERRPLPVAIDIIEGGALYGHSSGTLTSVFNGGVPGLWLWEQSPTSLLARYGSIRGASSFGLSYPKVYIDGIQVANPLLLTRITPEAIDHIEVIRGPQGAALYGADAISGVANVVLKQEGADGSLPRARFRSGLGLSNSDFAANPALDQSHVLSIRGGSNTGSATLNLEGSGIGAYIPGAYQRLFSATGAARAVTPKTILTGSLRFFAEQAGTPVSPLLTPSHLTTGTTGEQSVTQYTVGTNLKIAGGGRFTNSLTLGVDGYTLTGVPDDRSPIPSAANAALQAARGGASRGTIQLNTVAKLSRLEHFSADLTLLGEQSLLYQWGEERPAQVGTTSGTNGTGNEFFDWRNNTGLSAQLGAGVYEHFYLTGGMRVERTDEGDHSAALPMLGAAYVIDRGIVTLKLRGAYGKGIRWPETEARETMWRRTGAGATLSPEEQSGIEGGIDLLVGRSLSLQLTRYDQVASGLIQRVLVSADSAGSGPGPRRISYQSQNVGEVSNRGWELQGSLRRGRAALTGTLSLTSSVIRKLSPGYSGDLAAGDRMLDVPARTLSLGASWFGDNWSASITGYRAANWVSYDRLTLVEGLGGTTRPARDFVGPMLRNYWINYSGITHLGASLSRSLWRDVSLTFTGANLLDRQRGEPDNVTILPGRTVTLGVRAGF